jgi:hypothetical protein
MKYRYRRIPKGCTSSAYHSVCRACNAPIGFYCLSWRTGRTSLFPHRSRKPTPRKIESAVFRPVLPDLSAWWKSMRPYEGESPKPRPADLVVP